MIVFLDVDGVLTNFNKPTCQALKVEYPPQKWHWYESLPNGFNKLNNLCTRTFWANLKWMDDGEEILYLIEKKFKKENIYLLTSPMPNVQSATGKWAWIKHCVPYYYNRVFIGQAPKKLLAKPDTLLIDDNTKNVDEFRQAGGQTILVPRPWNSLHLLAHKSVEIVKQQLAEIKCES